MMNLACPFFYGSLGRRAGRTRRRAGREREREREREISTGPGKRERERNQTTAGRSAGAICICHKNSNNLRWVVNTSHLQTKTGDPLRFVLNGGPPLFFFFKNVTFRVACLQLKEKAPRLSPSPPPPLFLAPLSGFFRVFFLLSLSLSFLFSLPPLCGVCVHADRGRGGGGLGTYVGTEGENEFIHRKTIEGVFEISEKNSFEFESVI